MPRAPRPPAGPRPIDTLVHTDTRRNIPTAEFQSLAQQAEESAPLAPARYKRASPMPDGEIRPRNADRDPQIIWNGVRIRLTEAQRRQLQETGEIELGEAQLVWRGKDAQDWSDLMVNPPPIYIQEKVHPKAIIEGLRKEARARAVEKDDTPDLFADFNGLTDPEARLEFYQHDQHWSNRMILGDSLQVMASLAEREGLRGKVQCIYFDPPYGIKFNSNWQVSTLSRDVKDGKREDVSREPEQVKAFRDTWKDGIHSYLTYLRDRLTVARELLAESGSIFVQISDENAHRVRLLMDEIFGAENFIVQISYSTTTGRPDSFIATENDLILFFCKSREHCKFRTIFTDKNPDEIKSYKYVVDRAAGHVRPLGRELKSDVVKNGVTSLAQLSFAVSQDPGKPEDRMFRFQNRDYDCGASRHWKTTNPDGLRKLARAGRLHALASQLNYIRIFDDNRAQKINNIWLEAVMNLPPVKLLV